MRSLPAFMSRAIALSALAPAVLLPCRAARSDTLTPVSQSRSIHAMVIVPPCNPATDGENDAAIAFEPFKSEVDASSICSMALATSDASQNSHINTASVIALGETSCNVLSKPNPTVIHAIPRSNCSVTFDVPASVRYFIHGELITFTEIPIVACSASVRLSDAVNQPVFTQGVTAVPGGGVNILNVHASGALPAAGQYTLLISGISAVDAIVPPSGAAASSFDITAEFQRPGDANIDGVVNIDDLLAVIAGWGACPVPPAFCPVDMNASGSVDIDDLLLVISQWG